MHVSPYCPPFARVINSLSSHEGATAFGRDVFTEIHQRIPGWSHPFHYTFFFMALEALPNLASVLVCGVYRGLDLALITAAAQRLGRPIGLTGVDLFADAPCADWTPEQKARGTWSNIGIGLPPDFEAARIAAPAATLVRADSASFMRDHPAQFNFIYLDTSHDEQTVRDEIAAARIAIKPGGLLAGDDYCEAGTQWGVDRAVGSLLPNHAVFYNRIWLAQL